MTNQERTFKEFLKDKGDAKKEQSKVRRFWTKRSVLQKAIVIAGFSILGIYALFIFISFASAPAVWVFLVLLLANLITAMWLLNKLGLAVAIIGLLGVLMRYGFFMTLAYVYITTAIYLYFSTRSTPIDFMITKGVQGAMAMTTYQTLWVIIMAPIVSYVGIPYILSHIVSFYMFATGVYIVLMLIFLPMITKEPFFSAIVNGMVMGAIEYAQAIYIATWFFPYLMSV